MKANVTIKKEAPTGFAPLDTIVDHPDVEKSYRELDKDHAAQLSDSIERDGLDVPLIVWDGDGDATVEVDGKPIKATFLLAGLHRRHALQSLKKRNVKRFKELFPMGIPVIQRSGDLKSALCSQLRENCARKDPSAEDLFPIMCRLRDEFNMNGKQIAAAIGRSSPFVTRVFAIEELGEEGKKAVKKGQLSAHHAIKAGLAVKAERKAGKTPDVKKHLEVAKAKTSERRAKGLVRDEKKMSAKRLWKIYKSLVGLTMGKRIDLLEGAFEYLAEDASLPKELKLAKDKKSKTEED
jgi:ParB-like chromosome segregation protein Spo0J